MMQEHMKMECIEDELGVLKQTRTGAMAAHSGKSPVRVCFSTPNL